MALISSILPRFSFSVLTVEMESVSELPAGLLYCSRNSQTKENMRFRPSQSMPIPMTHLETEEMAIW